MRAKQHDNIDAQELIGTGVTGQEQEPERERSRSRKVVGVTSHTACVALSPFLKISETRACYFKSGKWSGKVLVLS